MVLWWRGRGEGMGMQGATGITKLTDTFGLRGLVSLESYDTRTESVRTA